MSNEGFTTEDGYAAVPYGKQFIVIYEGFQIKLCKTESSARKFIKEHRSLPKEGTIFI